MSWIKYKLVIILFALVVAGGVSIVLSGFNHMIRPAGPVSAFRLEDGGSGVYRLELLGEKIAAETPPDIVTDLINRAEIKNGREYVKETLQKLERKGGPCLNEISAVIKDAMKRAVSDIESRAGEIKERLSASYGLFQEK